MSQPNYPIGVPGEPWSDQHKADWLSRQRTQRSYFDDVLTPLAQPVPGFERLDYGSLNYHERSYPLIAFRSRVWDVSLPSALVTGGVHGYETSGVMGAMRFLQRDASRYAERVNLLVLPCISPWAYETVNRWNPLAIDPNRSFYADSPAPESTAVLQLLAELKIDLALNIDLHIDLHETTDTDASEFRPALAARDGQSIDLWEHIPDGFYLVGDSTRPAPGFQAAIIAAVEEITHIAPPDESGEMIGEAVTQHGVINYANRALGLCAGITDADYVTTTEVYPDSPQVDAENCTEAQVTAVVAALEYLLSQHRGRA